MLNTDDIVPLYKQLEALLEGKIHSGEYKAKERIPSEIELANQFDVSVITVKKAVSLLVERGLVQRKQGKGTFVSAPKYKRDLGKITSFSEACRLNGSVPSSKTLVCRIEIASQEIIDKLECKDNKVVYISRLRYTDGEPIVIENNWLPLSCSFLMEIDLENDSLFEALYKYKEIEMHSAHRTIDICRAASEEAKLLKVSKGAPLLYISSIVYSVDNVPVFVGKQIINAERYSFTL